MKNSDETERMNQHARDCAAGVPKHLETCVKAVLDARGSDDFEEVVERVVRDAFWWGQMNCTCFPAG